jgi:hypothetical protein
MSTTDKLLRVAMWASLALLVATLLGVGKYRVRS